ncbi:MAG: hypothetical protein CMI54_05480 [Parcubacteria group bacterium]|jgi:hypothetical protein|nr:hypothetical protein [Parcubacteria group bacterium]
MPEPIIAAKIGSSPAIIPIKVTTRQTVPTITIPEAIGFIIPKTYTFFYSYAKLKYLQVLSYKKTASLATIV